VVFLVFGVLRKVPLYEYECGKCGRFERIRKFADPPLTECPTCGQRIDKLASAPAIQFKGTGWYITDYARKSGGKNDGSTSAGKDGAGAKDGSKDTASASKDSTATTTSTTSTAKDSSTGGGSSTK
jgi:putative FmdB family regulatory protein